MTLQTKQIHSDEAIQGIWNTRERNISPN